MFDRMTREDRMILAFATQEAADLGHTRLGNDHLILGMLCNARSPLFALLAEHGLTLDAARETVRTFHDEHTEDDESTDTAEERYEQDRDALRSIGIDLDKVRAAVRDRFGDDVSTGWGERRGRGPDWARGGPRGRGRGRGHGPHGRRGGPHGRRGPGAFGYGAEFGPGQFGPGFGPGQFGPGRFGPGAFGAGAPDDGDGQFGPGAERGPFGPGGFGGEDGPWEYGRGRRGPRGRGGRPRFGDGPRETLRRAVEISRERGDRQLRAEYVLLGIIDTADDASRAVIDAATDADTLRAAVLASLPDLEAKA